MDLSGICSSVEGICLNVRVSVEESKFDLISNVSQFRFERKRNVNKNPI